jgi:hypothetical protein
MESRRISLVQEMLMSWPRRSPRGQAAQIVGDVAAELAHQLELGRQLGGSPAGVQEGGLRLGLQRARGGLFVDVPSLPMRTRHLARSQDGGDTS